MSKQWPANDIRRVKSLNFEGCTIGEIAQKMDKTYDSVAALMRRQGICPNHETPPEKPPLKKNIKKIVEREKLNWKPVKTKRSKKLNRKFKSYLVLADIHVPYFNKAAVRAVLQLMEERLFDGFIILGDFMDMKPISHWLHGNNKRKSLENLRLKEDYVNGNVLLDEFDKRLPKECDKRFFYGNHENWVFDFYEKFPELEGYFSPTEELKLNERGYTVYEEMNHMEKIGKLLFTHGMYHNVHFLKKHIDEFKGNIMIGHLHTSRTRYAKSPAKQLPIGGFSIGSLCDLNPDFIKNRPSCWIHGLAIVNFYENGLFNVDNISITDGKFIYDHHLYDGNVIIEK